MLMIMPIIGNANIVSGSLASVVAVILLKNLRSQGSGARRKEATNAAHASARDYHPARASDDNFKMNDWGAHRLLPGRRFAWEQ